MCLAVPTRLIEVDGPTGKVELGGTVREVGLQLLEEPRPGDYVLVHAGFAIEKMNEEEARKTLRLWDELSEMGEGDEVHG